MAACKNCKSSILSQTVTLIGNNLCNPDCPEETTCTDIIPGACIYYSGAALGCAGIAYGDSMNVVIQKMDSRYGVRVTSTDNCCGFLADKIVSESIAITQDTEDNCQVLRLEATGGDCTLNWQNLTIELPFVPQPQMEIHDGATNTDLGLSQYPQYAIEYCGDNIRKIWLRGQFYLPTTTPLDAIQTVVTGLGALLVDITPVSTRMFPIYTYQNTSSSFQNGALIITGSGATTPGEIVFYSANGGLPSGIDGNIYFSLDGYSYEIA